jgi:cysteine desulfurase
MAAELMRQELESGGEDRIREMRDSFERHVLGNLPDTTRNGHAEHRLPNTSSLTFPGIDAAGILILLDENGVACSAGSACHTTQLHPSHVLEAMGFDADHARSTLRFSWSRFNNLEETHRAAEQVVASVKKMRALRGAGPVM